MPPRSAKSSATAIVTGAVAANIAIGRLDASMLDTATTSSMTNSMKVLGAFVGAHHGDHVRHPGDAEEQVEHHEAHAPAARH